MSINLTTGVPLPKRKGFAPTISGYSIGRSVAFDCWFAEQSPDRKQEILQAERTYLRSRVTLQNDSLELAVADSMEGYTESTKIRAHADAYIDP